MATRHVLAELAAAAASTGLPALEIESVGGVDAARRVAAGEEFDLVFLAADALARLAADGHVDASTVTPLMLSQTAVAVPADAVAAAGTVRGSLDSADAVRTLLRAARRIGYSTGPSGTALVRMIDEWGMADELADRLVQARPGIPVARALADGDVDLGFQQLSELAGEPGVRILGVLEGDCAIDTVFAGAVAAAADDATLAARMLAFLASARAADIVRAHGFRPQGSATLEDPA